LIEATFGTTPDNGIMALITTADSEKKYYYYKCFEDMNQAIKFTQKLYMQGGIAFDELHSDKWIESEIINKKQ
jgi:hypothetical protein